MTETKPSILLVEDEENMHETLKLNLELEGYSVTSAFDGAQAMHAVQNEYFDLIIMDVMIPQIDGFNVTQNIRLTNTDVPILILSAKNTSADRVTGLKKGADDYLTKPFDLSELSARLAAVARRYSGNPNPLVDLGEVQVDLAARMVLRAGRRVDLTAREWALFEAFVQRPGQVISKAQLEDRLYAFGSEVESNTIEVHVSRLRKKLDPDGELKPIETVRGRGYRFAIARTGEG